jgi:hydroxymethylbilane synthase
VTVLRLATRGSALALAQSRSVASALMALHPDLNVELSVLKSEGDQRTDVPLSVAGGQGLFTKVLEEALLRGDADLAVHSLKDLPTAIAPGLALAAIGAREDWRDAWISPGYGGLDELPEGACVGTGSSRRRAQLSGIRPGLRFAELRGNVDTRLKKVAAGEVDGAVLALAGLRRLGLADRVRRVFSEREMLPAPGQGFIAIETLAQGDAFRLCRAFNHPGAEAEAACERAFLARLQVGCMAPVGALARTEGGRIRLQTFVGLDPERPLRQQADASVEGALELGRALAEEALGPGA